MTPGWTRRTGGTDLLLSGQEHSQLVRNVIWGLAPTHHETDPYGPEPYILFEPIGAAGGKTLVAAGKPTGGGGGGSTTGAVPTDIRLSNAAVDETAPAGTLVGALTTVDADKRESFTYTLLDNAGGRFAISGSNLVTGSTRLDYETGTSHQVQVQVRDKQGNLYSEWMTISVRDIFEGPPEAPTDITLTNASVTEGAAQGTVVGRLGAVDRNPGDSFTYALLDNAGGRFAISGTNLVTGATPLDYETATSHQVRVRVTDGAGLTYDETMTIGVLDSTGLVDQPNYIQAMIPAVGGQVYYDWPDSNTATPAVTIKYTLLTTLPSYYSALNMAYTDYTTAETPLVQLTATQRTAIAQILDAMETFAKVEFVEVATAAEAHVTFGMYLQDTGIGAYAYYPSASGAVGTTAGDVWLNSRYDADPSTSLTGNADWARSTIAHELGHAMGLKHPGNYDAGGGSTPPPYLDPAVDNGRYTVMSYNDFPDSGVDPVDYMLYDIAALQFIYGANMGHATGNDLYLFSTAANLIDTVWDAGGADTFSAAGATAGVTLDLNAGSFSSVGIVKNIGIAYGTTIEAAQGGSGADRLVGNAAANTFGGGAGADTIVLGAGWGDDVVLDFADGSDRIQFVGTGLGFASLAISDGAGFALVQAAGGSVRLNGLAAAQLDAADFLFA